MRPATRLRYAKAVRRWLAWVRVREASLTLRSAPALLGKFVEEAYQEGDPMSGMQDLLAGAQLFWPALLGTLRWPWRLLRTWARAEPVRRSAPIPCIVAMAIAGSFLLASLPEAAALTLVGFHCFLRSGELFALKLKDITYPSSGGAVVVLPETKSGSRRGAQEIVLVRSQAVVRALQRISHGRHSTAALLPETPSQFRRKFQQILQGLGLEDRNIAVYSLRRGGCVYDFKTHGSIETTLIRGRWAHASTSRIYLQEAVAEAMEWSLEPELRQRLQTAAAFLQSWLHDVAC